MRTEIPITIGIVLFLLYIAGATLGFLTGVAVLILTVILGLIAIFFLFFSVVLFSSRRHTAYFARFGSFGNSKFESAVYSIEGAEYFNAFPKEVILAKRLYNENKPVKVWLARGEKFVLDKNAVSTIIAGDIAAAALIILFAPAVAELFSGAFFNM